MKGALAVLLTFPNSLYASSSCYRSAIDILSSTAIPAQISQNQCKAIEPYDRQAVFNTEKLIPRVSDSLFHISNQRLKIDDRLKSIADGFKSGKSLGAPGFNPEGNAFLVKNKFDETKFITAKHVLETSSKEISVYVFALPRGPILFDPLRANPDYILVDSNKISADTNNDFVSFPSNDKRHSALALNIRSLIKKPLKFDEPLLFAGRQGKKLKNFKCKFKGYSADDLSRGRFAAYIKCNNRNILLGGLSGGVITDEAGNAVAVFNGLDYLRESSTKNNFVRITPFFESENGELTSNPLAVKGAPRCLPCFSTHQPHQRDPFTDLSLDKLEHCMVN